MSFSRLALGWTSFVHGLPSPTGPAPLRLGTPPRAWDYGAGSDLIDAAEPNAVLRVHLRGVSGEAGLALVAVNYGAVLTQEARITPGADHSALLALPAPPSQCRILIRGQETDEAALLDILEVEIGRVDDLSAAEREAMLRPAVPQRPHLSDELREWSPRRDEVFTPLGLGNTCEAKFQISRVMQFRRDPETSEIGFRLAMLPPLRSEHVFGWELFDWQGTSLKAVQAYMERDFEGVFERADLTSRGQFVMHKELGTYHEHDFEVLLDDPRAKISDDVIDRGYPLVRARFDGMASRFRDILTRPGPFLYVHVCEDIPGEWALYHLVMALRSRSPDHRFRILFVAYEGSDTVWGDFGHAIADKAFRPRTWEKPEGRNWEGPDEAWDRALAPYRLAFPDGVIVEPQD